MNNDLYIQSFCLGEGKRRKGKVSRPESGEGIGPNGQEASLPTISHTKKVRKKAHNQRGPLHYYGVVLIKKNSFTGTQLWPHRENSIWGGEKVLSLLIPST